MAGVNVEGSKGKRRSLDSEINMIPMIDLLMVTISFLLITAVWVHSSRLEANAQVPGPPTVDPPCTDCKEDAKLHVQTADPAKFVLVWKQGQTVVRTVDVPRDAKRTKAGVAFPGLAQKIAEEHKSGGIHRDASDKKFDRAVVHAANDMPYSELIAVMDAVGTPKRNYQTSAGPRETQAFDVTFATD
jgi:biopolymer transport protein ExbD